ncbi:hypothetical protein DO97_10880 [Neosynechococcus sphagnicola sy1]|uniref:Uncharacterized protein n=1 Tax=Neosynechococcus sphagnicola sy1 TaxID=1497020 RepID=A0A098TN33_9CYAN|nr:hypothetical protein [Neosynechococcus sphagnicola]KGF72253.1 hypothetical protein DO97_10880 [Neosynechococcus sphagnicola sy1]
MYLNPHQPNTHRRRGQHSRDRILEALQHHSDQSREDLMRQANLTYDQVRDQTRNLCIDGRSIPGLVKTANSGIPYAALQQYSASPLQFCAVGH